MKSEILPSSVQANLSSQTKLVSFQSNLSSMSMKYGGLIKESFIKNFKNDLNHLITYMFAQVEAPVFLHHIVTIMRIMQYTCPAFFAPFTEIWDKKSPSGRTMSFISSIFHFFPPEYRQKFGFYFLYAYIGIMAFVCISLYGCSYFFKKNAHLPVPVVWAFVYFYATLGFILNPVALEITFEDIGRLAFQTENSNITKRIVIDAAVILTSIGINVIDFEVITQSLMFRHASMMTSVAYPQNLFTISSNLVNAILGLAATSTGKFQIFLVFAAMAIYTVSTLIPFTFGGFIYPWTGIFEYSASVGNALCCVGASVYLISGKKANVTTLFCILLIHVASAIMCAVAYKSISAKYLRILDSIMNDPNNFDLVRSSLAFFQIVITGFKTCHPIVIDWSFFKMGVERWGDNGNIWLLFAKFIAIYPEETQTLCWILKTISKKKVKGNSAHCIKMQSQTIFRSREPNLVPELKERLAMIQKRIHTTMFKMGRVWDVAIQSNIREVELSAKEFIKQKKDDEAAFEHLFRLYPNNRFVFRSYGHFLNDIEADHIKANEMFEKMKLLQSGHSIGIDIVHKLGIEAFPNIPDRIKKIIDRPIAIEVPSESLSSIANEFCMDEDSNKEATIIHAYKDKIYSLNVPAVDCSIISRLVLQFMFCIAVYVFFLIYINSSISSFLKPLQILDSLSKLTSLNSEATAFSNRLVYQALGAYGSPIPTSGNVTLNVYNGSWAISDQLACVLVNITKELQVTQTEYSYLIESSNIDVDRNIFFNTGFAFLNYCNSSYYDNTSVSIVSALSSYVVELSVIISSGYQFDQNTTNGPVILNPLANSMGISDSIDSIVDKIKDYLAESQESIISLSEMCLIGVCIIEGLCYIASLIHEIVILKRAKTEAYRCLTLLPKNVLSTLADNLRIFRKKTSSPSSSTSTDQETSKRDESITKMFNIGVQQKFRMLDFIVPISATFILIAINVVGAYLLYNLSCNIFTTISDSANDIDVISSSYATSLLSVYILNSISLINTAYSDPIWDNFSLDEQFEDAYDRYADDWEAITNNYSSVLQTAAERFPCSDKYQAFSSVREIVECYEIKDILEIIMEYLNQGYSNYISNGVGEPANSDLFTRSYDLILFPLYDSFFNPVLYSMMSSTESSISDIFSSTETYVIIIMVIGFLIEIIVTFKYQSIKLHIMDVLNIMLQCNPSVICQSSKIMAVLSGNFSPPRNEFSAHSGDYFDRVFNSLLDASLYANQEGKIVSCNDACSRLFGIPKERIIGSDINDFIGSLDIEGNIKSILNGNSSANEKIKLKKADGGIATLSISNTYLERRRVILTAIDITTTEKYHTLIEEERKRSDKLLASIIPGSLIPRVQAGEKQISFSVQSASIIFIDVVEFTPWCGSQPASKVMRTLNNLFGRLDSLLSCYPTISRIKGIGDCYMAAAGIFSDVNLPAEHAKEAVKFGLSAIEAVEQLDKELGEGLRIRVGINTGGPIIAGVLGISKPTFEIFGPAINMAQQMEHHGVPMQVHISRSVYELIYGESFRIKERGAIEVKGGQVVTYLVTRSGKQ